MSSFAARLADGVARVGPLCVGIDPHVPLLRDCGLPDSADGALEFGRRILRASEDQVAIVKPQSAFFERYGSAGVRAMEMLVHEARERSILVLFDGKRGDIDSTGEAYAQAYFRPDSPMRVDAMTWHVYLGFAALRKALEFVVANAGGAFIVVRSSNPEGQALQNAHIGDSTVARQLCDEITAFNVRHGVSLGPIGAVVGATCEDAASIMDALPQSFILAPGIGAQGATYADIVRRMPTARGRVLPSVSRGVLARGTQVTDIAACIRSMQEDARRALAP